MTNSLKNSFAKSQLASLAATVVDYSTLIVSVEVFHIWYVLGTGLGAALGAVANFLLGRHWSFKAKNAELRAQAFRYASVALGSLGLNMLGVYAVTEGFHVSYALSKIGVSIVVGLAFNFPLHRYFVFPVFGVKPKDAETLTSN